MVDLLSGIIANLKAEIPISSVVDYIRMEKQPLDIQNKFITVRVDWDDSDSILPSQIATVYINIFVKDSVTEPYKTLRDIAYKVKEHLNRLNKDLDTGDVKVYQIVKTSIKDLYEDENMLWRSIIMFDVVMSENRYED